MRYNPETVQLIRTKLLKVGKDDTSRDKEIAEQSDWEIFTLLLDKRIKGLSQKDHKKIHSLIKQCFGIHLE